jgi:hypothetical protein
MAALTSAAPLPRMGDGPSPSRRRLALAVLCVSLLIVNLDNTFLNVALPILVRDLHAACSQLQWIIDAYIVGFAGLVLVAGSLADRIGRKRTFVVGLSAFAGGSGSSSWAARRCRPGSASCRPRRRSPCSRPCPPQSSVWLGPSSPRPPDC